MASTASASFVLRAATAADYDWLWDLKRDTMRGYVEQTWGFWDDAAQEEFFRRHYSPATIQVVVVAGRDAGLLQVEREPRELFLANIQILPALQRRGLGSAVVTSVTASARALGLPVRLQVLRVNRDARRLYERLGFGLVGETPTHQMFRWWP